MKNKIINKLINDGVNREIFEVHEIVKERSDNRYYNSFKNATKEVKYYILYIKSINTILVWLSNESFSICSISKKKVLKGITDGKDFVQTNKEYSGRGTRKIYISNYNNIANLIKKLDQEEINNQVCMEFAKKIRDIMEDALIDCLNEVTYDKKIEGNNIEKFELLRKLSALTTEFLKYDDIENKILTIANQSTVNGNDNKIKLDTFKMIRNVIMHFPIFDNYNDIVISEAMLLWNDPLQGFIKKYFDKYGGKNLTCSIYYKHYNEDTYKEVKKVTFSIGNISNGQILKLSDMITLNDAIWMFSIIDYYLDYIGLDIHPQFGLSM